jgi:hypothetical protein
MDDLVLRYNYDEFSPEKFAPWMGWDQSPALLSEAPDFPLWQLDERETSLSAIWKEHRFLIAEFGSFT